MGINISANVFSSIFPTWQYILEIVVGEGVRTRTPASAPTDLKRAAEEPEWIRAISPHQMTIREGGVPAVRKRKRT